MEEIDLDVYRWKNRVVLVFGRSKTDRLYMQQRSELEGTKADLTDRDVAVFELLPAGGSHVGVLPLSQEQHALLRKRFGVGMTEFQIVLVGKDGTVKLRSSQPVTARELFDLIDSMPMRREEMKKEDPSA